MTLTTRVRVVEPTPYRPIFNKMNELLGAQAARVVEDKGDAHRNPSIGNEMGQGFAAWLDIEYGGDGPLKDDTDYCTLDDCDDPNCALPAHRVSSEPHASIEVTFDTTYGYRGADGANCGDLHAWLIVELGRWLDSRGLTWLWYDESRGSWHRGYDALGALGNPAMGALPPHDSKVGAHR